MCLDDHSLTYCQENPLVKIWKLYRTAYKSVVDLRCQQFYKNSIKIFLKGFFFVLLFYNIHESYCTYCQEISKILVWLYQTPFVPWNKNHSSIYCTFCCIIGNEFLFVFFYFRETFFRNFKIVDWFGSMNWFSVVINITSKSLLNMTFHETYIWLFLWPQEFFLFESSCKFIFFRMTSDTYIGSYDLRYFNWKVVRKPNWVNVSYKS